MKFDKTTVVVMVLCIGLLFGWQFIFPYKAAPEPAKQDVPSEQQQAAASSQAPAAAPVKQEPQAQVEAPAERKAELAASGVKLLPSFSLQNSLVDFEIDPNKGCVSKVEFKKFQSSDRKTDVAVGSAEAPANALALLGLDGWTLTGVKVVPSSDKETGARVVRSFKKGDALLDVSQSFELGDSYVLKCAFELSNAGSAPLKLSALGVSAGGLPPLKRMAGDNVYTDPHRVDVCFSNNKHVRSFDPSVSEEKFKVEQTLNALDWVGSSNKYFAALLVPKNVQFTGGDQLSRVQKQVDENGKSVSYFVPSVAGQMKELDLVATAKALWEFDYYAGPKEVGLIKAHLPESALDILHLSYWSWFEFLARPLLWLLNWLKDYCGSYGVSIILLTVIVRLVFWPATQKANKSMRRMQKLQPRVQEIREKFKDDSQKMNMKIMELYKTEKVNPLGGCLPLLLQLPVFFALYSTLDAAVELRHVSFLWAADLSKPDLVGPPLIFGVGLHPFIILMTILMIVQQKLTPTMGDPLQQKMMMAMPLIMLVMLYNLPSGLTLYWTISNGFSILQLLYNLHVNKREDEMEALKSKKSKTA